MWIIPINISLFKTTCFNHYFKNSKFVTLDICRHHISRKCKCMLDDGTFIVQIKRDNVKSCSIFRNCHSQYSLNTIFTIEELSENILFAIVWIKDFSV